MRINTLAKAVLSVVALLGAIYGYGEWRFDKRVKTFNSSVQIGDSYEVVRVQLGRPSLVLYDYATTEQVGLGQNKGTEGTVLWVYSGSLYFRNDLSLIFDRSSGKLIKKNRESHYVDFAR